MRPIPGKSMVEMTFDFYGDEASVAYVVSQRTPRTHPRPAPTGTRN